MQNQKINASVCAGDTGDTGGTGGTSGTGDIGGMGDTSDTGTRAETQARVQGALMPSPCLRRGGGGAGWQQRNSWTGRALEAVVPEGVGATLHITRHAHEVRQPRDLAHHLGRLQNTAADSKAHQ